MFTLPVPGEELRIDDNVRVIPTPGHTLSDVTVLVKAVGGATIAIVGEYYEYQTRKLSLYNMYLYSVHCSKLIHIVCIFVLRRSI